MMTVFPFRESERGNEEALLNGAPPGGQPGHADPVAARHRGRAGAGARRTSTTATTTPTRRSAPTWAARRRCTRRRPTASCARATSRSSSRPSTPGPVFGPAARPLPQLPITVNDEGYFVATGDFDGPVGPAFWEMGKIMSAITTPTSRGGTGPVGDGSRRAGPALPPGRRPAPAVQQGLPDALVVHARRGRALQLHRAAALRHLPGAVLRPVDGRGRLRRAVRQPARRARCPAPTRARWRSRSRSAAGCSSARCTTGRRCCSSPRCSPTCSARSSPARSASRVRRTGSIGILLIFVGTFEGFSGYSLPDDLLSGTGLRIASGITLIRAGDRHLDALGAVRRRVPRHRDHPAALHHPRADPARASCSR